ncbi:hypothetical protein HDG32_002939 [Paraburkholderia sp. CI2]|uniref:hypothetical protein n=1 Tax=Paraburkholderia sp. CI2 TaxID=2723093 RepID=UPI001620FC7A|nr:hypothetical protein [Paraburkholderia sp. CI2]MBB5466821.1 hypothetical protein [Paraburkholderia sp. CI2]
MDYDSAMNRTAPSNPDDAYLHDLSSATPSSRRTANPALAYLAAAISLWCLIEFRWEARWEFGQSDHGVRIAALVVSKAIVIGLGLGVLAGRPAMRMAFLFLCVISVACLVWSLPHVYHVSRPFFLLSLVECAFKTGFVVAFALDVTDAQ